jgi:hypothetical protein
MDSGAILLVEADPAERVCLSAALESVGFAVSVCPGPSGPDYTCVGDREGKCPLVPPANAVVLDLALQSEDVSEGTSPEDLLGLYLSAGKPVIALGSWNGLRPYVEEGVIRLPRYPDEASVIEALSGVVRTEGTER